MSSSWLLIIFKLFVVIELNTADQIRLKFNPTGLAHSEGLIWYDSETYTLMSEKLDSYLEVYRTPSLIEGRSEHLANCSYENPITDSTVCNIKPDLNACSASNHFGYKRRSPCIYIELDKILNWKPMFYNSTKNLPEKMPTNLKDLISVAVNNPHKKDTVWLWCEGESPEDKELIGPVSYYPRAGFPGYMFPYTGQPGYLSPLVAVHFEKPAIAIAIHIVCKLWSPNIAQDYTKNLGLARFTLINDE
ncbi:sodium/potassium-transporting ATPase subunit beta-2-like [Rhodnius prolixus]|uniref:Uncharacterized protein n=1 Tax=Rhodnius prolixus TaxID=13249 RepID=T1HMN9_RHOPR